MAWPPASQVVSLLDRLDAYTSSRVFLSLAGEFGRYFAAGLIALGVDFSLYVALKELAGWHYLASATVAFCTGLVTIYFFSILWVFQERGIRRKTHEFALFAVIGIAGLGLTVGALYVLTEIFGLDYRFSKVVSTGLVFLFNFGCRKFFLFHKRNHGRNPSVPDRL